MSRPQAPAARGRPPGKRPYTAWRDAQLIALYLGPSQPTLREVGRAFGLTPGRVHQILAAAEQAGARMLLRRRA